MNSNRGQELKEKLAAIEHERWASWQEWVHTVSEQNPDGSITIPKDLVERWNRQIATPYGQLSEDEKLSDLNQVDRYWDLVRTYCGCPMCEYHVTARSISI